LDAISVQEDVIAHISAFGIEYDYVSGL